MSTDLKIKLDKSKKYLVGVSGGPDSMALLSLLWENEYQIVVAHVNYHVRKSANRDTKIVKKYCLEHKIKFINKDVDYTSNENFEAWARDIRYKFYEDLINKYQLDGIVLGHHEDDLIETYLMQLKKASKYFYYGLREKGKVKGLMVYRPLLKYQKEQLIRYLNENNIEYGIDETNDDIKYKRNAIRKELLGLSLEKRKAILTEIKNKNKELIKYQKELKTYYKVLDNYNYLKYKEIDDDKRIDLIRYYLIEHDVYGALHFSLKRINSIDKQIMSNNNQRIMLDENWLWDLDYGKLTLHKPKEDYEIKISSLKEISHKYFDLLKKGKKINGVYVSDKDFPLMIRNYQKGDYIKLRYGVKKLNRFFIDRKIPKYQREIYPVLVNSNNEIILVPLIGCDVNHYNKEYNCYLELKF